MQDRHLTLVVRKLRQRTPEIFFFCKVTGRRLKPRKAFIVQRNIPPADPGIVQGRVAHTREQVCLYICCPPKVLVFQELQEDLVEHVLRPASFAGDRGGKQQERRAMLAVQLLDLRCSACGPH